MIAPICEEIEDAEDEAGPPLHPRALPPPASRRKSSAFVMQEGEEAQEQIKEAKIALLLQQQPFVFEPQRIQEEQLIIVLCYNEMKHMTCVNHKEAEQVCINPECRATCAYICLEGADTCRNQHEACPLAFLAFLARKSNKIIAKAHDIHIEKLINFHQQAKKTVDSLSAFLESYHLLTSVKQILDPHGLL
jgi:hypothetical protein